MAVSKRSEEDQYNSEKRKTFSFFIAFIVYHVRHRKNEVNLLLSFTIPFPFAAVPNPTPLCSSNDKRKDAHRETMYSMYGSK
jgi:hypothetical protein